MALTDKLTAIADAIRAMTGGTEPLTLDQMPGEIASISGGGATGIYMAQVTPASDLAKLDVTHNLGTTDLLLAACFAESFGDATPSNYSQLAKVWVTSDIPVYASTSQNVDHYEFSGHTTSATSPARGSSTINVASVGVSHAVDKNTFQFTAYGASQNYRTGVTYNVIIVARNAEV